MLLQLQLLLYVELLSIMIQTTPPCRDVPCRAVQCRPPCHHSYWLTWMLSCEVQDELQKSVDDVDDDDADDNCDVISDVNRRSSDDAAITEVCLSTKMTVV